VFSLSYRSIIPQAYAGAKVFHKQGITGTGIGVAIFDSGIAYHPDFSDQQPIAFCDLLSGASIPYDDYSHGTHVAGIIASRRTGIAPGVSLIVIKVLDRQGNGTVDSFIGGIQWLLTHYRQYNVRIVNISMGGSPARLQEEEARLNHWVAKLWHAGLVVCCSAGNNGPIPGSIIAPGSCPNVITVGSSDGRFFSSAGPSRPYITKPEVVAPGLHILSTYPKGGYGTKSGTSMSVPFLSGYCALLLQCNPSLSNDAVKIRLMNAATPLPRLPYHVQGAGVVQLDRLLYRELSGASVIPSSNKKRDGSSSLL
jgi:serine protease AprX